MDMSGWSIEFLNEAAEAEFNVFPANIKAKVVHISRLIEELGLHSVGSPYLKHVQGKIWEIRASQGRCLYVTAQTQKVIILRKALSKSLKSFPKRSWR